MAFKLKGFPMHKGVSPLRQADITRKGYNAWAHVSGDGKTGDAIDQGREDAKQEKQEKIDSQQTKYDPLGNIIEEPKGIDRWIDKPIMEVLGLTKKQRAARKEKRAGRVADARKAEGEGTETLKQAKLVKRDDKRKARTEKRKAKDQKKLAKWRKKNPKQDKKLKDRYGTGADAAKKAGKTGDEPTGLKA